MIVAITTVKEAFDELLRRIELNPTRVAVASQRYNAVKAQIESALPGKTVLQVGSFQRKTKIKPLDSTDSLDIDAIVCFGDAHEYAPWGSGTTPSMAMEIVRRALTGNKTYRLMDPRPDAPTVTLEYSDNFQIELIPCFRDLTGNYPRVGGPACYIVGNSSGAWMSADYEYDAQVISGLNQARTVREALVPSIKMIKAFLCGKNSPLKSFHVEILCAQTLPPAIATWETQRKRWGYHHVLAYFLSTAHASLLGPVSISNSFSTPVDSDLAPIVLQRLGQILNEFGQAAWKICAIADEAQALDQWRSFFGDPFPAGA